MTALADVRQGIAENLSAISGVQVSAYSLANPTPPTLQVTVGPVNYVGAFDRGVVSWTLFVQALIGITTDIGAQRLLDELIDTSGERSVKEAVELDDTLGGTVADLVVTECTGYREYLSEGRPPVLGAQWTVVVTSSG